MDSFNWIMAFSHVKFISIACFETFIAQAAKMAKRLLRQNFINPKSHVTLARFMVNSSLSSRGPTLTSTAPSRPSFVTGKSWNCNPLPLVN